MDVTVRGLWVAPARCLGHGGLHLLFLDFAPQPTEKAHVQIGHRCQRESRDQIASPIIKQQLIARDVQEDGRDVVAEAILAREKIKELPLDNPAALLALRNAPLAGLAKDVFVRDSPGDGCNRYRQDHQEEELPVEIHISPIRPSFRAVSGMLYIRHAGRIGPCRRRAARAPTQATDKLPWRRCGWSIPL